MADRAAILLGAVLLLFAIGPAAAQQPSLEGDGIAASLTGQPGDPVQGRRIVIDRQKGMCLLCHPASLAEERFPGNLAPSLDGVGSRLSPAQLRLRLVDGPRFNPQTIMPSYFRTDGLQRVGRAWQGKPILTAAQIEDVVAFLATLRGETKP